MRRALIVVAACSATVGCGTEAWQEEGVLLHPNGDLLAANGTVTISEDVAGDAMLVGGRVEYSGNVGGSYLGAGGEQSVRGRIDGSARVAGGTVRLAASVGRNVTLAGGRVELSETAEVEQNAYLAGDSIRVQGPVGGDLYVGARSVVLEGPVGGDVRVEAERLYVGPQARLSGDLRYRLGEEPVSIDPGARIEGEEVALEPREGDGGPPVGLSVLRVLSFLVFGAVLIGLFPSAATAVVGEARERPGACLGLGLVAVVAAPVAILACVLTVIGIPVALLLSVAFAAALYLAPAVAAMWLGGLVLTEGDAPDRWHPLKTFLIGGPLVAIAILLPWVGFLVRLAVGFLGLGAMTLAVMSKRQGHPEAHP